VGKKPEEEGQRDADDKRRGDRKIKGAVLAAMDDVAGETAEAEREAATEIEQSADDDDEDAEDEEDAAEIAERIHPEEF
jgi:hypothetical protein